MQDAHDDLLNNDGFEHSIIVLPCEIGDSTSSSHVKMQIFLKINNSFVLFIIYNFYIMRIDHLMSKK